MEIIYLFLVLNISSFLITALDKAFSKMQGQSRVPEKVLLFMGLAGGAVGIWLSMRSFRHKTRKPVFKYFIPFMAVLHLIALAYFMQMG